MSVAQSPSFDPVTGRRKPAPRGPVSQAADAAIGARLRAARMLAGISQSRLGDAVGITFQQIQKYEKGHNRIGGSRIQQFAQVLNVSPAYFFGDAAVDAAAEVAAEAAATGHAGRREALDMMQVYTRIADPAARRALRTLAAALAGTSEITGIAPPLQLDPARTIDQEAA